MEQLGTNVGKLFGTNVGTDWSNLNPFSVDVVSNRRRQVMSRNLVENYRPDGSQISADRKYLMLQVEPIQIWRRSSKVINKIA